MKFQDGLCLTGAVLALGLASLPAAAQGQTQTTPQATTTQVKSTQTDMSWDRTIPLSPGQNRLMLLQMMADKNFTSSDIIKVIPLLQDLRDAEHMYVFGLQDAAGYWVTLPDMTKMNGMETARTEANNYRDRRQNIWAAIDAAVGPDKAGALRSLVEPTKIDYSTMAYTDEHIMRIDELIREWDRLSAARIAANPGTAATTPTTVSVETKTTVQTIPGIEVYSYPPMTTAEVVNTLAMRLVAMEAEGAPEAIQAVRDDYLTYPDLLFLRQKRLMYWD